MPSMASGVVWICATDGHLSDIIKFLAINWAIAWVVISEDGVTVQNLRGILDTDFMGLVSCLVAFWFGNRTFGKRKT